MDRCMDCGGVLLTVNRRCLPSAATTAAKTPGSAATGGVGQYSGAAWAGTSACCDASQGSGAVEHAFANRTARSAGSARLQSEAKIGEIGRIDPPAQVVRASGDLQSVGTRFEGSHLYQFPRVDVFTCAGRIAHRVVVKHSASCLGCPRAVQLKVRGSDDISLEVDADLPVS